MTTSTGRIDRAGKIHFHDASLAIWEDGLNPRMSYEEREAWERQFKREVFKRILQTLNRLGWTCVVPARMVTQYGTDFARSYRDCAKGELKGELSISGRTIKFEMWQGVNTPTRPDHGGRYEFNKEGCMPYLLRLEMERSRRRIRDYLLNVFAGYSFEPPDPKMGLMGVTAIETAAHQRRTSGHYDAVLGRARYTNGDSSRRAKDGELLEHGCRVWGFDHKGCAYTGTAYYSLNDRWQVITGRYGIEWANAWELYTTAPPDLRIKRNTKLRRKRLEQELQRAMREMRFERAAVLRDLLFTPGAPLYFIYSKKHDAYFGPNYSGYTKDSIRAGRYTNDELTPYLGDIERGNLKAVEVAHAHA